MWERKTRSKLGRWLDDNGFTQEQLRIKAGVGRNTVSKACSDPNYMPRKDITKKLLDAVREIDPNIKITDFWDL